MANIRYFQKTDGPWDKGMDWLALYPDGRRARVWASGRVDFAHNLVGEGILSRWLKEGTVTEVRGPRRARHMLLLAT